MCPTSRKTTLTSITVHSLQDNPSCMLHESLRTQAAIHYKKFMKTPNLEIYVMPKSQSGRQCDVRKTACRFRLGNYDLDQTSSALPPVMSDLDSGAEEHIRFPNPFHMTSLADASPPTSYAQRATNGKHGRKLLRWRQRRNTWCC